MLKFHYHSILVIYQMLNKDDVTLGEHAGENPNTSQHVD